MKFFQRCDPKECEMVPNAVISWGVSAPEIDDWRRYFRLMLPTPIFDWCYEPCSMSWVMGFKWFVLWKHGDGTRCGMTVINPRHRAGY